MVLKISNLSFYYPNGICALSDVNFEIKEKNLIVILGESGCGKTTLAKVISGILTPKEGKIIINNEDVTQFTTASRDLTMVFQNYVLYPHMTIYENVYTSLNGLNLSEEEKDSVVKSILSQFGLGCYLNFKPRNLSDGQKQRVAICKALVRKPFLFILDEPLANLDFPQRKAIRSELKSLYEKSESSFLYITHDIEEAEYLSTVVIAMDKGKVLQMGSLKEIRNNPKCLTTAKIIYGGLINTIENDGSKIALDLLKTNKKIAVIPYKGICLRSDGKYCSKFISAKITPNGVQITLLTEKDKELCAIVEEEEVTYKENDTVYFDVVKSFIF